MPTILDNLIATRAIPLVVTVLLGNGPGEARCLAPVLERLIIAPPF